MDEQQQLSDKETNDYILELAKEAVTNLRPALDALEHEIEDGHAGCVLLKVNLLCQLLDDLGKAAFKKAEERGINVELYMVCRTLLTNVISTTDYIERKMN